MSVRRSGGMPVTASARPNHAQISYAPRGKRAKRWECPLWALVQGFFLSRAASNGCNASEPPLSPSAHRRAETVWRARPRRPAAVRWLGRRARPLLVYKAPGDALPARFAE
eukprot:7872957-Alexandrium_andersonii.AAC.1